MAHINKLGDVSHGKRYEVRWSSYDANGKRRFQKERFRTEEQAKAKKRQVEQGIADGDLPDSAGGRKPLRYWAERWYASKSKRIRPNTAYAYRSILDSSVLPAFGEKRIRSLTAADIQEWWSRWSTRLPQFATTTRFSAPSSSTQPGTTPSGTTLRRTSNCQPIGAPADSGPRRGS